MCHWCVKNLNSYVDTFLDQPDITFEDVMATTISIIVLSQSALMVFPLEMQLRDNCVHVYLSLFLGCVEVVCVCDMDY